MNSEKKSIPTTTEKVIKAGLTHAGKERAVNERIEVTAQQREFLVERGFIASSGSAPADPANSTKKGA